MGCVQRIKPFPPNPLSSLVFFIQTLSGCVIISLFCDLQRDYNALLGENILLSIATSYCPFFNYVTYSCSVHMFCSVARSVLSTQKDACDLPISRVRISTLPQALSLPKLRSSEAMSLLQPVPERLHSTPPPNLPSQKMLTFLLPALMLQCTPLSGLSGTVDNTSLRSILRFWPILNLEIHKIEYKVYTYFDVMSHTRFLWGSQ